MHAPALSPSARDMTLKAENSTDLKPSAREWASALARYREPNQARSVIELGITLGLFAVFWLLMWMSLAVSYWLSLLLSVPAAGFLLRLFMIQHDCGHGSFFRRRAANDWVGRAIGALTLTPYDVWRRSHAVHHAGSGNLDHRGTGDITTLTVREYLGLPQWRRLCYRLYRNPVVMFGLGPAYVFLLQHRLPIGLMRSGLQPWISAMATNAAIASAMVLMIWLVGAAPFFLVHLPITLLAASIGVWLFYIQHQFEHTFWDDHRGWTMHEAALHGSSHTISPPFCSGSRLISASIMSIISAAAFRTIGCRASCAIIPNSAISVGSVCDRASAAFG